VTARRAKLVAQGIAIGLVALLFALLVWTLVTEEGGDLAAAAARGERPEAPDFTLERLDEEGELTLSSLRGKAVVLNVWASWCIPCKEEAPFLEQVWREHRDRGLVVVGLDAKDFRVDARRFAKRFDLTFPLVYDGPGDTLAEYGVTGFPETFVIDRAGRVVEAFVGGVNSEEDRALLRTAVDRALETAGALGAPAALAADPPRAADLEAELVCPVCETTLDQSDAPVAKRMKAYIRERIAAGDTEDEIKDALVAEFGEGVLATPPKSGFGLLAWLLPLGALVAGALVIAVLVRAWSRRRPPTGGERPLDPELERRVDEELARFED
jgi:cytochrome c biogenesis protein CcmG/thiol:disulfide interchange protein DsbE